MAEEIPYEDLVIGNDYYVEFLGYDVQPGHTNKAKARDFKGEINLHQFGSRGQDLPYIGMHPDGSGGVAAHFAEILAVVPNVVCDVCEYFNVYLVPITRTFNEMRGFRFYEITNEGRIMETKQVVTGKTPVDKKYTGDGIAKNMSKFLGKGEGKTKKKRKKKKKPKKKGERKKKPKEKKGERKKKVVEEKHERKDSKNRVKNAVAKGHPFI